VDFFNGIINSILRGYVAALAWAPAGTSLALISIVAGIAMLWVFQRTTNPTRIRAVKRRVQAHLLEIRVFGEEPAVVWGAQKSLVAWNMRYMGLMLMPAVWMAIPLSILLIHLEAFYGRAPLAVGRETIVTMAMHPPLNPESPVPVLHAPQGIAVETPAVRAIEDSQISWRIRPSESVSGSLSFQVDGQTIEKKIEAGSGLRFVPGLRVNSVLGSVLHPDEPRIQSSSVDWIDVRYPDGNVKMFGLELHWLIWFTIISMLAALLLKKRFGVVF
jgi:hypothetical protein